MAYTQDTDTPSGTAAATPDNATGVDAVSGADASAPDAAPPITASDLGSGAAPSQGDEDDVRAAMGLPPDGGPAAASQPVMPADWNPAEWDGFIRSPGDTTNYTQVDPTIQMNAPDNGASARLLPQYDALGQLGSLGGAARPLGPGEFVSNADGSWSNEITASVQDPSLNGGRPTVVPTLWVVNGKPMRVTEDQAAQLAARSGLQFPAFGSMGQAEQFAQQREASWQHVAKGDSTAQAPLWSIPGQRGVPEDPTGQPGYRPDQPGTVMQQESASYRGAGGPQAAADVFGQYRQRAEDANATDAQLTAEQLQRMQGDTDAVKNGLRGQIAANIVYIHRDQQLHDAMTTWAENQAAAERQANLQYQAKRQRVIGDYQSQLAAVRQLAMSSGNPYESMTKGQAIGLAGAEFAQGFLAAQGVHINVSGQIDNFVDRSIAQHQQAVQNGLTLANDQLHLYDVARQSSQDDAEARQRYGGFVVAGLQAQIQANANRYQSNLASAQAATAIAQLQVKADQYQQGVTDTLMARDRQRLQDAQRGAALQMQASIQQISAETKQMAERAKLGAMSGGGAGAEGPEYIADPTDVQYKPVVDPNTGAVVGHQAVSGGRNTWRVMTAQEAKARGIPEASFSKYYNDAHDTQGTYDYLFGLIDRMRQLRTQVNTGAPDGISKRLNAARASWDNDKLLLAQALEQAYGVNAGNLMRNFTELQKLMEMAPDNYLLGKSQAPALDNTAGEIAAKFRAKMAANPAVVYSPQKTYKPYLNVARQDTALGNAVVHPMKMSSALPEQQESALEDVSREESDTSPGDTGKASQMFVNYLNSPANRSGIKAKDFLATNGYRNEYKAIDALAYYAHNPKYIAQTGSLVPVETANDARTRLEAIAAGKFTNGREVPGEIRDYTRYVLSHMQDAEASFTGDDASRAKLKAVSDSLLPSVEYTRVDNRPDRGAPMVDY